MYGFSHKRRKIHTSRVAKNVIAVGFNQRIEYIAAWVAEEINYYCRWF